MSAIHDTRFISRVSLIAVLLCAACSHQQHLSPEDQVKARMEAMHEAVGQYVPDPERAARLNRAIDGMRMDLLAFRELLATTRFDAEALNAHPEATRADFEALVKRFDSQRTSVRTRLIDWHLQLIGATTNDEWKRLARYEREALTSAER